MAETTRRAFVCGRPVAHSRSPLIHGYWLAQAGIDGSYTAVDVAPEDFAGFIQTFAAGDFVGGNVTIPHKEAAFALAAGREEAAERIGAANTLWLRDGKVIADNTDWFGFSANLDDLAPEWRRAANAVVLGAGGAARGVIFALRRAGIDDIRIVNRTASRALDLAGRFGGDSTAHGWEALPELLGDADLLVNTTALGMEGNAAGMPDLAALPSRAVVADIVYVPLETPLLAAARERGLKAVDGLGMLLHQAAPGFERWFGVRPEVTPALRRLILDSLGQA